MPSQVPVTRLTQLQILRFTLMTVVVTGTLLVILKFAKGSIPVFDALITALSLTAQRLLNLRKLESWYVWIVVDLISIPVYVYKQLYLVAVLYGIFLVLCVYGYQQWRQFTAQTKPVSIR